MRTKTTRAVLATLAIGAAGMATSPALAGEQAKSKVKIKRIDAAGAAGTVRSPDDGCEPGRKVKLFLIGEYVPVRVGKDTTNANGKWKLSAELARGRYYAKVSKSRGCKAAESKTVRI